MADGHFAVVLVIMQNMRSGPTSDRGTGLEWRGWGLAKWLIALTAVGATWVVTLLYSALIALQHAGVCREAATPAGLAAAQRSMTVCVLVCAAPWALTVIWARYRLRLCLFATAALLPITADTIRTWANSPADFSMQWCLF